MGPTAKQMEDRGNGTKLEIIPAVPPSADMMELLHLALTHNAAIDVIERLVALRKDELSRVAETEFNEALNKAQAEIGRVAPDRDNKQTSSRYASYAALDRAIRPIYTKHGFSLSFDEEDSPKADHVRIVAFLSRGGYTRKYRKDICADGKGAKGGDVMTRTHAEAAADSYGMRYLTKKIFNVAIAEDDDDGNLMPENQEQDFLLKIREANTLEELGNAYRGAIKSAVSSQDYSACKVFKEASQKREQELRK